MPTPLTGSQNAVLVKYKLPGENTWQDVARRVAHHVASVEATDELKEYWEERFYDVIEPMLFVPGGSILANSGHGTNGLMNCFALSAEDNIFDIVKLISDSLLTTKFRGGVGINIGSEGQTGYIRPAGTPFKDGQALGPLAVLDMVSENCKKITTGNKSRRGAFLFSMDWRHPDIFDFINVKKQSTIDAEVAKRALEGSITAEAFKTAWQETHLNPEGKRDRRWHNANISVQLDDEFFELLDNGGERCTELWQQMAMSAHATADPGILFIEEAKRRSPLRDWVTVTNPCGELFLPPNSSCNLGSLTLPKFLINGRLNLFLLAETTKVAIRFLDNVLDTSEFATAEQKHNVRNVYRQLGLGVMGWSDYLKSQSIAYDTFEHLEEIDRVGGLIAAVAYRESEALATEKGACGIWEKIKDIRTGNPFEQWVEGSNGALVQTPRRNSTVLSVAPTGSIAQLAGCSWAFEPDFGLSTWKQVFVDAAKGEQNWIQILSPYIEELGLSEADQVIVLQTGSLQGTDFAEAFPAKAAAFKIAREITPAWHINVQAQWQTWLDSSVSKTINLPAETTPEEIAQTYLYAKEKGLKGVTVYRSGTLESEPVKVGTDEAKEKLELPTGNEVENKTYSDGCKDGSCSL